MYRRFLNNSDYKSLINEDVLKQLVRGDYSKLAEAEQSAEMAMIEYLTENYEIEQELNKGKYIAEYDRKITFPVGAHVYINGEIYQVIRSISGYKKPSNLVFWEEYDFSLSNIKEEDVENYSQFKTYYKDDVARYNGCIYICLEPNGYMFNDIRIPLVNGWDCVNTSEWLPIKYRLWDVVEFDGNFFTLISLEDFDNMVDPMKSDCWGMIAPYDEEYNEYGSTEHDYVVYENQVFKPYLEVNSDSPKEHYNVAKNDPRNANIKKQLVRIALYEVTKLVAANNVGVVRVKDYDEAMEWLKAASKLKINPHIPRKLDQDKKEIMDWQLSTFQAEFNPYQNMWMV